MRDFVFDFIDDFDGVLDSCFGSETTDFSIGADFSGEIETDSLARAFIWSKVISENVFEKN